MIEKNSARSDASLDIATIAALGKLLRASVAITGVLLVLQSLGVSVAGVLAFGGIGGIAIGFAAKDLLANFFGALMIFLDRPFSIGDWIRSPDREIEGVVEDIGWRSTKIRTFDKRPLFIPNSAFASLTVENASKMQNRRIFETIGLRYDDIDKVKLVIDQCRLMLSEHPEIDDQEILMVNFVSFAPSSLDFFVYAYTRTIDWESYHLVKEDVLMKIAEIIKENGAQIAFPTQSLEITQMPGCAVSLDLSLLSLPETVPVSVRDGFHLAEEIHSKKEVAKKLDQLAIRITSQLQDENPIIISILHGGLYLTGQLYGRIVFLSSRVMSM